VSPIEPGRIQILEALARLKAPPVSDTEALGLFLAERGRLLAELDTIQAPAQESSEWLAERECIVFLVNQGEELRHQAEFEKRRIAEELQRLAQARDKPTST